jgi:transcriptional regulator with XRE-family HTH domain
MTVQVTRWKLGYRTGPVKSQFDDSRNGVVTHVTWQTVAEGIAQARREMSVRERRDVSGEEIAEAVGVTPAAYSRWEKGDRTPSEDYVRALAAFFGVTPAYLRYGEAVRGTLTEEEVAEARARLAARPPAPPASPASPPAPTPPPTEEGDPPEAPRKAAGGNPRRPKRPPNGQ